jgi:hypothetical protein
VVIIAVLAAALAAFLVTREQGAGYDSADQLVSDLEAGGVRCVDPSLSDIEQMDDIGVHFGACTIDGQTVNINVYRDPERVREHITNNVSVRGQSANYFTSLVAGPNWVVDTYSEDTAAKVKEALGGTIR